MQRDTHYLATNTFEAIVVGGGIHGATVFYQLAAAGVRVALVEKDDFGAGTSANSLKILHGGLRYLQHLNIKRMRESINSRKYYMEMAPHLITPLPCVIPTFGLGMKGRPIMAIAMKLFDLISWDRNKNSPAENRVGRGRLLNKSQCLKIGPGLAATEGLTGGALWYDDLIINTERMALAYIKAGVQCGGVAANYVRVRKLSRMKDQILGAEVTDRLNGRAFVMKADLVINAAGPWIDDIRKESHQASTTEDLAKAVNIVVKRQLFHGHGFGLEGTEEFTDRDAKLKRSKRLFFFVPWKNNTIIGTTYTYYDGKCDDLKVGEEAIAEILDEVNAIYPDAALTSDDVVFSHAGLMPAHKPHNAPRNGTPQLVKHSRVIDHEKLEDLRGLLTIEGVKYTTAPAIARQVEKLLRKKNFIHTDKPPVRSLTNAPDTNKDLDKFIYLRNRYPHIEKNYGKDSHSVYSIISQEGGAGNFIPAKEPITIAEILYAVREEMAVRLSDVVLRRTECGTSGCPPKRGLRQIAEIMANELNWNDDSIEKEIDQVISHYRNRLNIEL